MPSCFDRARCLAAVCACALLLGSVAAGARDKQEPVPQWGQDAAKTPTPDYAKDSGSVVLYDEYLETIDEQGRATEREREAIRILQPQGRHDACLTRYDVDEKINYFREWTITAKGEIFQARDTDFSEEGDTSVPVMLFTAKARVVHPPAEDVGATIVCESEEVLAPWDQEKIWDIQKGLPVVFEALEVDLPAGRPYAESWHRFAPVKATEVAADHWRWEIRDMPRLDLRDVKESPDWAALAARMSVAWGDAAVQGKDNQWRALGQWFTTLESGRPNPTPEITAKAEQLTAGAPDFYTKLKNITEYIQGDVRYFIVSRGIGGMQAHYAGDIFRNQYGDCKDKTTLLIAMLQAVGIKAFYVPVDDRRGVVDPNAPSLAGNHMITAIEIPESVKDSRLMAVVTGNDGKRYLIFDPTNERTPVGNLPSDEQGGYGLLAAGPASQVIALPVLPPAANGRDRTGRFTLAADGALSGTVDTSSSGPMGADLRKQLKYSDEKERHDSLEKSIVYDLPGAVLGSFQYDQPSDLDKPLRLEYKVTAAQYAHAAGPLLLVRPRVVGDEAVLLDDKPRTFPIELGVPGDLGATGQWRDSFDVTLPPGYVVDETPDPVNVDLDFASYHSATTAKGTVLHYEREYTVRKVEIPASRAADFRRLESAILSDERGTAVLKKQ